VILSHVRVLVSFSFLCGPSVSSSGSAASAAKKSFTADSGLKYQWDDKENDWVECNGPDRWLVLPDITASIIAEKVFS
jgi:hypothetical protein